MPNRYGWFHAGVLCVHLKGGRWMRGLILSLSPLLAVAIHAQNSTHVLQPSPTTVHWGYYDAAVKPVLHIKSGDTVIVETAGNSDGLKA
jgi:hypothetical protein